MLKISFLSVLFLTIGCQDFETEEKLEVLVPASSDEAAKDWNFVLLSPDQLPALATPTEVGSAAYQTEWEAVRTAQTNLTSKQQSAIRYWGGGGVLRWNQLMRELVARYNLPPAPNADGTYTNPNASNPFAYPTFPFATPPYASRAYAYVSAALHDALAVTWRYKFQFARVSPSKVGSGVQALLPTADLPSYPSEEAVMSAVAEELMKLLFPVSADEITAMAAQQRNVAVWSGKAVASDVEAGVTLGKAVAAQYIERARNDGMRNAVGQPEQWAAMASRVEALGEIAWKSLDLPARPPMLPLFGEAMPWIVSKPALRALRPGPPPSTSSEQMRRELEEVRRFSENLTREQLAIAHKWADGVGTYTPPGHWNDIATEYIQSARMSEVRTARTLAALNMAMHNGGIACWDAKFYYCNPRPSQLDSRIRTVTGVPNFPAYVSGHSVFSAAAATVLGAVFPQHAPKFEAMAQEAADSRLYGAIHYRSDVEVGNQLGKQVGQQVLDWWEQD